MLKIFLNFTRYNNFGWPRPLCISVHQEFTNVDLIRLLDKFAQIFLRRENSILVRDARSDIPSGVTFTDFSQKTHFNNFLQIFSENVCSFHPFTILYDQKIDRLSYF